MQDNNRSTSPEVEREFQRLFNDTAENEMIERVRARVLDRAAASGTNPVEDHALIIWAVQETLDELETLCQQTVATAEGTLRLLRGIKGENQ